MKIAIQDWKPGLISGLDVQQIYDVAPAGDYYDWRPMDIVAEFASNKISGGVVEGKNKPLEYEKIEWHPDYEMFCFVSGEGVMLFCDQRDGKAVDGTYVMLHIVPGMILNVHPEKAHFVPISFSKDVPLKAVVIAPKGDTSFADLDEKVEAE